MTDAYQLGVDAADARALINSEIFDRAMKALEVRYMKELVQAPLGDLTATAAHARLKAIQDIRMHLNSYSTDEKMFNRPKRSIT